VNRYFEPRRDRGFSPGSQSYRRNVTPRPVTDPGHCHSNFESGPFCDATFCHAMHYQHRRNRIQTAHTIPQHSVLFYSSHMRYIMASLASCLPTCPSLLCSSLLLPLTVTICALCHRSKKVDVDTTYCYLIPLTASSCFYDAQCEQKKHPLVVR
jgi:hypothetical protein